MDVGGSCCNVSILENNKKIEQERKRDAELQEILCSTKSISHYDSRTFNKTLIPQILASSIAALFHIVVGISLAYSAILLPQLNDDNTDLKITRQQGNWIASVITITIPIGGMTCGFLMDSYGRLNTIKLSMIPAVIGWITIATANSVWALIIGRIITGIAAAWGTSPAMVYITEIARADMRGSLISFAPAYTSLGFVLAYLEGWLMNWRTVAWICNIYVILTFLLIFLIPESPAWLITKQRNDQARKALIWFNKYQPQPENKSQTFAELHLSLLINEYNEKQQLNQFDNGFRTKLKEFLKPTGYKPLLILLGLFVFQQFSGIYITLFYSITFFQEVGSNIDPYFTSILIGGVRFIMSIVNTYMLRRFCRRTLIIYGSGAMSICMFISGLYTYWIQINYTKLYWIPIISILLYVITSMIGLLSIPWTMTAELFPIEIRGLAHSIVYSSAYFIMFISIQNYNLLKDLFHGVAGLQWFFACISLGGLLYSYILLPETHGVRLKDIQEYFKYNCCYIGGINNSNTNIEQQQQQQQKQQEKLINNNIV